MPCPCYDRNPYPGEPHPDCRVHRPQTLKKKKGNPLLRTPLKQKSDKQKIRDAFLQGIKAERLRWMIEEFGEPKCEGCRGSMVGDVVGGEASIEEYIETCMELLQGHHVIPRDSGPPYKAWNDHGVDTPSNIKLLCKPCHRATEPEPQWN